MPEGSVRLIAEVQGGLIPADSVPAAFLHLMRWRKVYNGQGESCCARTYGGSSGAVLPKRRPVLPHAPTHRSSVVMASCVSASVPIASMRWKGKNCFSRSTALWCCRKMAYRFFAFSMLRSVALCSL